MSLHVEKLNVRYGKSHVVFDLDVKVAPGEVLALLGRNGAGKTTTIKAIVGLLPGTSGNVTVADLLANNGATFLTLSGLPPTTSDYSISPEAATAMMQMLNQPKTIVRKRATHF